jgi:hypothetical protein
MIRREAIPWHQAQQGCSLLVGSFEAGNMAQTSALSVMGSIIKSGQARYPRVAAGLRCGFSAQTVAAEMRPSWDFNAAPATARAVRAISKFMGEFCGNAVQRQPCR